MRFRPETRDILAVGLGGGSTVKLGFLRSLPAKFGFHKGLLRTSLNNDE